MRYLVLGEERTSYKVCFLVGKLQKDILVREYIEPSGIDPNEVIFIETVQPYGKKKPSVGEIKEFMEEDLLETLADLKVEYLFIADAQHFKTITKAPKADTRLGYVDSSPFGSFHCLYVPSAESVFYDPENIRKKIERAFVAYHEHNKGQHTTPGKGIIHYSAYPKTAKNIRLWLQEIMQYPELTCDIESFSLKFHSAGLGTIGFAWNQHEGIAFPVDYGIEENESLKIRKLLKWFFENYKGKLTFHNIGFDGTLLVYQIFMKGLRDIKGMLHGLRVILRDWDDTKLITYLATNTCAGNHLSLKDQSAEFAGDYAQSEINDITKIPLDELLQYNLVDCLATWFVKKKHWAGMLADNQLDLYEGLFKKTTYDIIQMQLTGMPVNKERVIEVAAIIDKDIQQAYDDMLSTHVMQDFYWMMKKQVAAEKNAKWKKKRITPEEAEYEFNPNSDPQKRVLLYELLQFPVTDKTDSGLPSTGGDSIKKMLHQTKDEDVLKLLKALIAHADVAIIKQNFIPSLLNVVLAEDGWHYLYGNFNLGGTISGRLSSSNPNMQNLPAKGRYAKLIKSCFQAPPGWIFCGLDYSSLEDRISALQTKDPNKLKVYTDGYDGHCLRAYAYFKDQMPDIDPNSVDSINSIEHKYKSLRTDSKTPTFLLTYDGTYIGIMQQMGWSREKAQSIENNYKDLYSVSRDWVSAQLDQATKDGYVTIAFGLRLRTPLLKQVIRNSKGTPYEATAEGRSAGNALGQSYGLLNNRSCAAFMEKVRASKHAEQILVCSQIHDAQYYLIEDDVEALSYTNVHLIDEVKWQEDPLIWHDEVKLGGDLSVFHPTWNEEISMTNYVTGEAFMDEFHEKLNKMKEKLNG